jgi:hypothetical protein
MLHIAADTWGIKSQTFLWLYGGLCAVWGVMVFGWRSNILGRGKKSKWHPADYELALLSGGPELAAFLDSLRGRAPSPPGFDGGDLAVARASLLRKRLGAVSRDWPALTYAVGEALPEAFAQYAQSTPPPVAGGGLADGLGFASRLDPGTLTDDARVEVLHARARFAIREGQVIARRGPFAGAVRLRHPARVLVVARLPGLGIGHVHLGALGGGW